MSNHQIQLSLSAVDAPKVVQQLLAQQIAFEMTFVNAQPEPMPQETTKNAEVVPPRFNQVHPKTEIIREIYRKYIENGLKEQPPLEQDVANEFGFTLATFRKYIKQVYGKSFYQLCLDKRMSKAATLLKQGYKANEVSQMIGYGENSAIKFNKMFQKHFGMTPKKYQTKHYGSLNRRLKGV